MICKVEMLLMLLQPFLKLGLKKKSQFFVLAWGVVSQTLPFFMVLLTPLPALHQLLCLDVFSFCLPKNILQIHYFWPSCCRGPFAKSAHIWVDHIEYRGTCNFQTHIFRVSWCINQYTYFYSKYEYASERKKNNLREIYIRKVHYWACRW